MAKGNFFSELKRRNVLRVGAAYAVGAFVLIEVARNITREEHEGVGQWAIFSPS